jgi:NADH:ubiquinone oxidoreductase subunit 6 (subunit J)
MIFKKRISDFGSSEKLKWEFSKRGNSQRRNSIFKPSKFNKQFSFHDLVEKGKSVYIEAVNLYKDVIFYRHDTMILRTILSSSSKLNKRIFGKFDFLKSSFPLTKFNGELFYFQLKQTATYFLYLNLFIFFFFSCFNVFELTFNSLYYILDLFLLMLCLVITKSTLNSFNYIVSLVYLIFLFSVSGLVFMLFGMNFVGLTLIAVYVGGVLLLFLSVIKFLGFRSTDHVSASDSYVEFVRNSFRFCNFICLVLLFLSLYYLLYKYNSFAADVLVSVLYRAIQR